MDIYIGHPSSINYKENLYRPIKQSSLAQEHDVVLPHEDSEDPFNSKDFLENKCDLMIAEVSKPSTGLGIELGWADLFDVSVLAVYSYNCEFSSSVPVVVDAVEEYRSEEDLIKVIEEKIERLNG